jgi:hypothetical protein
MPDKNGRRKLVRGDEPSQETEQGLAIPVPKRKSVMDLFDRAATKREVKPGTTRGKGKRSNP